MQTGDPQKSSYTGELLTARTAVKNLSSLILFITMTSDHGSGGFVVVFFDKLKASYLRHFAELKPIFVPKPKFP